jgi:hypothetical protein
MIPFINIIYTNAVVIVIPADGPSFGTDAAGKCTYKSRESINLEISSIL